MPWIVHNLWLIPALPILAAGLIALLPQSRRAPAAALAIGSLAISLVLSIAAFAHTLSLPAAQRIEFFNVPWLTFGDQVLRIGWLLDPITAVMLVMVTFVGLLIFIYSTGYMAEDENFTRFFCFLALFAGAMLAVLIANSLLLLFMAWEIVGLTSYLLIGFWYHNPAAAAAAKKAFLVTRIGDLGLLIGMVWLYSSAGTLLFYDSGFGCLEDASVLHLVSHSTVLGLPVVSAIAILIFCGAAGKSGQVPLHVWLPDAMEGPTPVSALIHAATMVAAGVFLMARVFPLVVVGLNEGPGPALQVVTWVGAITSLFAATIAVAQFDIKRILAYSTLSQLGFMVAALGIGGWVAAIFHLLMHAFFKALLFLGAGAVIHALAGEQDLRRMGNLRAALPTTHWTMFWATLAIAGIFPWAGFWSKDEILAGAIKSGGINILWWLVGLLTAFLTAFYMFRLFYLTFRGTSRVEPHVAEHLHEAPPAMRVPLMCLALLSLLGGFLLGVPPEHGILHRFLAPVFAGAEHLSGGPHHFGFGDVVLMLISLAVAVSGWLLARRVYVKEPELEAQWIQRWHGYYTLLLNKYYVDEAYTKYIVRPLYTLSESALWRAFDVGVVDRLVNVVGRVMSLNGRYLSYMQTGYVRTYALTLVGGAIIMLLVLL